MSTILGQAYFEKQGTRTLFHRTPSGPSYVINQKQEDTLKAYVKKMNLTIGILFGSFSALLAGAFFLLPAILELEWILGLGIAGVFILLGITPLALMVWANLRFQNKARIVLGDQESLSGRNAGSTPVQKRAKPFSREVRLLLIFLVGISFVSAATYMLFINPEPGLPFRKYLIWTMNLVTGMLLTGLGFYGLVIKGKKAAKNPAGKS